MPEKVPEKMPGEWLTKLSMTAPGCLHSSVVAEVFSLKIEAAAGVWGPGTEPARAGEHTGVAPCAREPGCGHSESKEAIETLGQVCVEWGTGH